MKNLFIGNLFVSVVRRCFCLGMICVIGLPCNTFADGDLFKVCFGSEPAVQGKLYCHDPGNGAVVVLQVMKNGVLVRMHKMFSPSQFIEEKIVFVKMESSGISDGEVLSSGLYRCTGTVSYETALGAAKTVPAFAKLSSSEESKIYRERDEAAKRWAAEEHARTIKEQPERKRVAESIIRNVDLDMGCIRISKEIAPSFEVVVKHFMWNRLVESKERGDWLGFLNVAKDIVNGRAGRTNESELFPEAGEIRKLCDALKKVRFPCELKYNGKLLCLVPNWEWKEFIDRCRNLDVNAGSIPRMTSSTCLSYSPYVPEVLLSKVDLQYGLAVLGDDPIVVGVNGSIEKYNRAEYMERIEALIKQAKIRAIPLSAYKAEMLAMDKDAWRKINEELIPLPHGAELERIRKADKDLKSAQQHKEKQAFVDKVSTISFCLGDYMIFQKGLLEYTHSVQMDEMWSSLSEFQKVGDWEAMARTVLGPGGSDLSDAQQWVDARKKLLSHEFKFKINFTRNTGYYQRRKNGWNWRSFCDDAYLEISQKVDESNPVYVYTGDRGDPLFRHDSNHSFDVVSWLKSTPADMMDHRLGVEFTKKSWPGPRDVSELMKKKDRSVQKKPVARRKISSEEAHRDYKRYKAALSRIKYPPDFTVVTNKVVSSTGKVSYKITKKPYKIHSKVRGLALLLSDPVVCELYGKYSPDYGVKIENFKAEWTSAGKTSADPNVLLADIERRIAALKNNRYEDPDSVEQRSMKELEKRRELYSNRASGYNYKPEEFKKWSREDNQERVFWEYLQAFESIYKHIAEATQ